MSQPYSALLDVPLIGQETNSWCWAASGQMVMQWFGISVSQCRQATYQFGQAAGVNCCTQPTPSPCISGGQVEISHYGFTYNQLGASSWLGQSQIETQIYTQVEPWIINPNGPHFGHVLVAVGYVDFTSIVPNLFLVGINDPWPQNPSFNAQGQATSPVVGQFYWEKFDAYEEGVWEGQVHTEGYDIYNIVPPLASEWYTPPVLMPPKKWPIQIQPELAVRVNEGDTDPGQAAEMAWRFSQTLVTAGSVSRLGFASEKSAAGARVAGPVEQFSIPMKRLRVWTRGQPVSQMLERVPALFVPVQVDGRTCASLRLRQVKNVWRLATFGSARLSQAWHQAQKSAGQFLVEIEGLELAFAGRRAGSDLHLTPLFSYDLFQLKAGHEQRAEEIIPNLVEAAVHYKPSILSPKPR